MNDDEIYFVELPYPSLPQSTDCVWRDLFRARNSDRYARENVWKIWAPQLAAMKPWYESYGVAEVSHTAIHGNRFPVYVRQELSGRNAPATGVDQKRKWVATMYGHYS